jgi:hypothetical protein
MSASPKEVFDFYTEYIVLPMRDAEHRSRSVPVEFLFEIHSAFDHLKRITYDNCDAAECCSKAIGHLKRCALDAYKLNLKDFNDAYDRWADGTVDWRLVNNMQYASAALQARFAIDRKAEEARMFVARTDLTESFDLWLDVQQLIDDFRRTYLEDRQTYAWARRETRNREVRRIAISVVVTGVVAFGFMQLVT